jgi:hypothetical protein
MVPLAGIELRAETLISQGFGRGSIPVYSHIYSHICLRWRFDSSAAFPSEKCRTS